MSSMNSEIKDKAYHEELVREIEIKEARSLFLLQEIQYLKTLLKQVFQQLYNYFYPFVFQLNFLVHLSYYII